MKPPKEVLEVPKTPNRNLLYYDDLDGRKFLYDALGRLDDRQRLSFVNWCCKQQNRFSGIKVVPTVAKRDSIYYPVSAAISDLSQSTLLGGQGGVDADVILSELYRRVRRK